MARAEVLGACPSRGVVRPCRKVRFARFDPSARPRLGADRRSAPPSAASLAWPGCHLAWYRGSTAPTRSAILTAGKSAGHVALLLGVYDIHSPRVPESREIAGLLRAALASVPAERLWVNPA